MWADPSHLRAQAKIDFELARQMSVPAASEVFRRSAEDYLALAAELEAQDRKSPASKD
jgi:hypothetical protein